MFEAWKARRESRLIADEKERLDQILADLERATVDLAGALETLRAGNPSNYDEETY